MRLSALASFALLQGTECAAAVATHDEDQILLASVSGGFGFLLLLLVISALREAVAMKTWPIAKGRILSSKVEEYIEIAGAGKFGGARAHMKLFRPAIAYEYEVAGQQFQGKRIAQSPGFNRAVPTFAEQTVARYPSGSAVDVRFNPKRPSECVLEPRVPRGWIAILVIAVGLMTLGGHLYYG